MPTNIDMTTEEIYDKAFNNMKCLLDNAEFDAAYLKLLKQCLNTFRRNNLIKFGTKEICAWFDQLTIVTGVKIPNRWINTRATGKFLINLKEVNLLGIESAGFKNNRHIWQLTTNKQ